MRTNRRAVVKLSGVALAGLALRALALGADPSKAPKPLRILILGGGFAITDHILQHGGTTIAQQIAVQFGSGGKLGTETLLFFGFVLFAITLVINLAASAIVNRSRSGAGVDL